MPIRVLIPLVDGFEEIEAITAIDLLRRADYQVVVAGIGKKTATGSHAIRVDTDAEIESAAAGTYDAIVLPGGPGTKYLHDVAPLKEAILRHVQEGKTIAAICAAPTILARLGLLKGRRASCHPSAEQAMNGSVLSMDAVVEDGNFITSRGAGTAVPFALKVIEHLSGEAASEKIARSIVFEA